MARARPRTLRPKPQSAAEAGRSGTRPVARKTRTSERPNRESQRPTVRVPASASLASYKHSQPRIQDHIPTVPALRVIPRTAATTDFGGADAMPETERSGPSLDEVPYVACSPQELLVAKLDHREGFVLSLVDGRSTVEAVIDACPMVAVETRRILLELQMRGLVALRAPRRRST
jgi:hypothetical protein